MLKYDYVIDMSDKRNTCLGEMLVKDCFDIYPLYSEKWLTSNQRVFVLAPRTLLSSIHIDRMNDKDTLFHYGLNSDTIIMLEDRNIRNINMMDDEDFGRSNAYLTAEGTLMYIIKIMTKSVLNCNILIIGYGRVGSEMVKVLLNNDVNVLVATDNKEEQEIASEFTNYVSTIKDSYNKLHNMCVIVNTVPAKILPDDKIELINKDSLIIDLSSSGGMNHKLIRAKGIKCEHLLGVPSKVVPYTAGQMVRDYIYDVFYKEKG